jgi:hypothetical protein
MKASGRLEETGSNEEDEIAGAAGGVGVDGAAAN